MLTNYFALQAIKTSKERETREGTKPVLKDLPAYSPAASPDNISESIARKSYEAIEKIQSIFWMLSDSSK